MPSTGPCANPNCKDKWNASGQFTLLSAEFCAKNLGFTVEQAHCGKRPCQRWVGKLPPLGQGGAQAAKRAAADGGSGVPVAVRFPSVRRSRARSASSPSTSCGLSGALLDAHPPASVRVYLTACAARACWTGVWT